MPGTAASANELTGTPFVAIGGTGTGVESTAGAGSAFLGLTQYGIGAIAAPLGGILGPANAIPAFVTMTGFVLLGLGFAFFARAAGRRAEAPIDGVPPEAAV